MAWRSLRRSPARSLTSGQIEILPCQVNFDEPYLPPFDSSAYLGAIAAGLPGALVACFALFAPGCLLIIAVSPFWLEVRKNPRVSLALKGVNAAAVGFVFAAVVMLYGQTVSSGADSAVVILVAALECGFGAPAPLAIVVGGGFGAMLHFAGVGSSEF